MSGGLVMTMTKTTYCWHRRLIHVHATKHSVELPSQYMHNQWVTSHYQYSPCCPASLVLSQRRSADLYIDRISCTYDKWLLIMCQKRDKVLQKKAKVNESEFDKKRLSKVVAVEAIIMRIYAIWLAALCMHIEFFFNRLCKLVHSCCIIVIMVEWSWWDSSLILGPILLQCFDTVGWVIDP